MDKKHDIKIAKPLLWFDLKGDQSKGYQVVRLYSPGISCLRCSHPINLTQMSMCSSKNVP